MSRLSRILFAVAALAGVSCASHQSDVDRDVIAPSAVHATVRVVNAETTWVAEGAGYELVGRSKGEIGSFEPSLDRVAATLHRVFPKDTFPHITATVRRMPAPGQAQSFAGPAPVPSDRKEPVVELVLIDRRGPGMNVGERVRPVLRAWLAAHAAKVTGSPSRYSSLTGEEDDPRVPAWSYEVLALHGDTTATDNMLKMIAMRSDELIPLSRYFMMLAPAFAGRSESSGERRGTSEGGGGEGGGVGRGGMGGRGMGGMGRGGGGRRGGMGSGGGERRSSEAPLEGLMLYVAQSAAVGRYLSRDGDELIGQLIDTQIQGEPIEPIFKAHSLGSLDVMDSDFRAWVAQHASR